MTSFAPVKKGSFPMAASQPSLAHKLAAEFLGTFVLVFGGCGTAVFAAHVLHKNNENVNMGSGSSASRSPSASRCW